MTVEQMIKENDFWGKEINRQLGRFYTETSECQCRKMSEEEIKKYCKK